ncbi:MAG TPA: PqqD family protein [Candidatus Omnitrophota bacterium]|nr:PqqD family protein [Candidatus Omnitrophota bacterium]HPT07460.1 PqqD family protein [Candidatus Omnitrophota bacterium]
MTKTTCYTIDREIIADRIVENEAVILNLDNGMYYSLNGIGTRIWQLLDEGKTETAILEVLLREYSARPETLKSDVEKLIGDLLAEKLIKKIRGK